MSRPATLLAVVLSAIAIVPPAIGATQTTAPSEALPESPAPLDLDRLYTLPWLIGTAPSDFAWSRDSKRLAFLWNDEGREHRDLWLVEVDDPQLQPRRVTRLPPPPVEPASDDPADRAAALDRAELPSGARQPVWHPDGRRLLFVWQGDLHLVAPGEAPLRLTATEEAERAASYSPDGRWLAWIAGGDLWAAPSEGGEPRRLTELADEDVGVSSYRWAPDSGRIALIEVDRSRVPTRSIPDYLTEEPTLSRLRRAYPGEEPDQERLAVVELEAADGTLRPTEIRWPDLGLGETDRLWSYRWSPAGDRLAVDTSDLYVKDRRILVVETESADGARTVVREQEPLNVHGYYWQLEWTADGEGLWFLSDRDDDYHVYHLDLASATVRRVTRGDYAVARFEPVDGGLLIVANHPRPEERQLFFVDGDGGEPVRLSVRPGTHEPTVSPDGSLAAVHFSSDETPPDLFLTELAPGDIPEARRERRVTDSPLAELDRHRWVTPRYVTFPSHVDGTTLHGRLTLPPDFDPSLRYPAILGSVYSDSVRNQWGGRTAHPTWGLDQYLAQQGYVLLNVDIRGSWGRGREHRRGIRLDYGGIDIEDLASGVHYLGTLGFVDMERVGIWGSSYGGLMTTMSLFRKPELYAAGIAGAPATNVRHALTGQMEVMMAPADQPEEYDDSSPYLHAEGLEDPLMIVHGMRDWIVLFQDSVTLVQRLILLGKDVDFVVLPDAGHGWDAEGMAQTRFAFQKMVEFFERHLGGPEPTATLPTALLAQPSAEGAEVPADRRADAGWAELERIDATLVELARPVDEDGLPDWSADSIAARRAAIEEERRRLEAIDPKSWSVGGKIDYLLVHARLEGLDFEHRVLRPWARDPIFWLGQVQRVPYVELPVTGDEAQRWRARLAAVPSIVERAQGLLDGASGELADLAIFHLEHFDGVGQGQPYRDDPPEGTIGWYADLCRRIAESQPDDLPVCRRAESAVVGYRDWLRQNRPGMPPSAGIGIDELDRYLRDVRLLPYDVDQVVLLGEREFHRYRATWEIVRNRNRSLPELELTRSREQHEERTRDGERRIRELVAEQELLSIPDDVPGEFDTDVFWSPRALDDRHFWEELQFRDTLNNHIHASIPGHRFDGLLASRVENPIRRRYGDSTRAEGWATYLEEMLVLAGITDDRPRAEELFWIALMKRASRIYAETMMHAGRFSLEQANRYMIDYVPYMEADLGRYDLEGYLRRPGLGSGYILGKIQLEQLLSERSLQLGDEFDLGAFHDDLLSRGMIPLTLLRWEMTGYDDQVREHWGELVGLR